MLYIFSSLFTPWSIHKHSNLETKNLGKILCLLNHSKIKGLKRVNMEMKAREIVICIGRKHYIKMSLFLSEENGYFKTDACPFTITEAEL